MIDLGKAISAINKEAGFAITDENVDTIQWNDGTTPILKADILAKQSELQAVHDTQAYARNRQAEYPEWGSQLNKIYDDGVTKWKSEMVDPIKAKWPKDNSGPV